MKTSFSLLAFLFFFSFSGFGQVVDTAIILRQADSLLNMGVIYYQNGDNTAAEGVYRVAKDVFENTIGKENAQYIRSTTLLANALNALRQYENSKKLYLEAKDIQEKVFGKNKPEYALILSGLGATYTNTGQYRPAEAFNTESLRFYEKKNETENPLYMKTLGVQGVIYRQTGRYDSAEVVLRQVLNYYEKKYGKDNAEYMRCLNWLAVTYDYMGRYDLAEQYYEVEMLLTEKNIGKNNIRYAGCMINLAIMYGLLGKKREEEKLLWEAKALIETTLKATEHPYYQVCMNGLAGVLEEQKRHEEALEIYLSVKTLRENQLGKEHPEYASSVYNIGRLYGIMKRYPEAIKYLKEASELNKKILGEEHLNYDYIEDISVLGSMYIASGQLDSAETYLLWCKEKEEILFGKKHPSYNRTLMTLLALYEQMNRFEALEQIADEYYMLQRFFLSRACGHLSEKELGDYMVKFLEDFYQQLSYGRKRENKSKRTPATCYDNILFYKGFLLQSSVRIRNLAGSDTAVATLFERLETLQQQLSEVYLMPKSKRQPLEEKLENDANVIEKELARKIAEYENDNRNIAWQDIQSVLRPGEAAIEFIRFDYIPASLRDSVFYAALLLKPGMVSPAFITLFEEKQLNALLAPLAEQGSSGINELYGGQAGQSLHRLLWSPVEPHLTGVKTVYYSPSGLMHRLNMSAIPVAKNTILADRHELVCLSSTRQLVTATASVSATATASVSATATALVYGGIQFDMDSTAYPVLNNLQDDDFSNRRGLSFQQSDSTLRGAQGDTWQYLKWSEKEADNVQNILAKAGVKADVRKGWQATEESFKQIGSPLQGDKNPSPRILHISTHGFFFPDPQETVNRGPSAVDREPVFKISDHPMIRSGLILAGGNYAWKTGQPLGNREDGILTAYEISQLDLRNTDLVVLSACETGLGQIEGNEGVYGLQRAFKIAGAKNLVMSLWQVPDYQTQELMTAFYRNMLEGKMPVRQALHAAQNEMRQKRYEPFYWAGFVLVE